MNSMAIHNPTYDKVVEKAITYLVNSIVGSGHNPKPVILHSIRTGLYLYHQNYSRDVVVAAILHDLIEDTDETIENIEKEFGSAVAKLVAANSFCTAIINRDERDTDMLNRCKEEGKWALLIKAADILDNSDYFRFCADEEQSHWLLKKMKYFLDISSHELAGESVWHCLHTRQKELVQSSGIDR